MCSWWHNASQHALIESPFVCSHVHISLMSWNGMNGKSKTLHQTLGCATKFDEQKGSLMVMLTFIIFIAREFALRMMDWFKLGGHRLMIERLRCATRAYFYCSSTLLNIVHGPIRFNVRWPRFYKYEVQNRTCFYCYQHLRVIQYMQHAWQCSHKALMTHGRIWPAIFTRQKCGLELWRGLPPIQ